MLLDLLSWAVLGLIAGAIAKAIYPGNQGGGILATMLLGIVGSLVGGFISTLIVGGSTAGAFSITGIIFAIIGAIVVIFIWGLLTRRNA